MSGNQDQDTRRVIMQAIELMATNLRPLDKLLASSAEHLDMSGVPSISGVVQMIEEEELGGALRQGFHGVLAKCDYAVTPPWGDGTAQSTTARRDRIYDILELKPDIRLSLTRIFPPFPHLDPIVAITDDAPWERWYIGSRRTERGRYWPRYERYLSDVKHWHPENIALVDQGATDIVERLPDPESLSGNARKGLVVGYVQSGKTSNFTAVIAKAADAGYRLFIVLAGTQNTLRDQTQRRLDKELVGREYLEDEYEGDPDWDEFTSQDGQASLRGGFDWERLTTAHEDFQSLRAGISALRFTKVDLGKPFRSSSNLHRSPARLIVVKKNTVALKHLITALKRAGTLVEWSDVPALVIDDESDQASLNTKRPSAREQKARTAINQRIVELLGVLKCAQYVGYTATPFANVFVDPDDAKDLFPSDFILSLPRPIGYMGAADFLDTTDDLESGLNRAPFVRDVKGEDMEEQNLPKAIDSFVLAGVVKLFRAARSGLRYKHHTMLVHSSPYVHVHGEDARRVAELFFEANYSGGGPGMARLRTMWNDEFQSVCISQVEPRVPIPESFEELTPYVAEAVQRIAGDGGPTIILNGVAKEGAPDFDRTPVWKIICGGAKLSRGYTVEGLTVSYYRRRAGSADTLMQMGRWFGYRFGYRDLVRLFIGRQEPIGRKGKGKVIDLYEAFRGVCMDEEEFRSQLERYASLDPGERITPKQVPPLVPSHYLRPAAANKMYNATLAYVNYGGRHIQKTLLAVDIASRKTNLDLVSTLLEGSELTEGRMSIGNKSIRVGLREASAAMATEFLNSFQWLEGQEKDWVLLKEFIRGTHGSPGIKHWLTLLPDMRDPIGEWNSGTGLSLPIRRRGRNVDETRFNVLSEPLHIEVAKFLAGMPSEASSGTVMDRYRRPGSAVIVPYLVIPQALTTYGDWIIHPAVGFSLILPENDIPKKVGWSVRDPANPEAVVVSV